MTFQTTLTLLLINLSSLSSYLVFCPLEHEHNIKPYTNRKKIWRQWMPQRTQSDFNTAPVTSREVFVWNSHADVSALQSNEPPHCQHKCNVQAPNAEPTHRLAQKTLCTRTILHQWYASDHHQSDFAYSFYLCNHHFERGAHKTFKMLLKPSSTCI